MKSIFYSLLSAVCLADQGPGFGMSVNQAGINTAVSIVTPIIFENLKDITLPEIDFDGGSLSNVDIKVPPPTSYDDITLTLENAGNDMDFVANKLSAKLTCDFKYKFGITVTGKANINIKKMNLDMAVAFSTQTGNPSFELAPKLDVSKINVAINPDDIDITLSGSLVSKIASVFIPLFKSTLIPMIVNDLEDQVKTIVDKTLDHALATNGTQAVIPYLAGVTFDFAQMAGGPQISTDQVFSMVLNGTFFDAEDVKPSAYTPATWSSRDPKGKMFQGYITDYTLNTAFESGFQTGNNLDLTYLLQEFLNVTVTTDQLGLVIPEFVTKYGAGKAVAISGMFTKAACETTFSPDGQTLDGNLRVTIEVDNEVALIAEFNDFSAQGKIYTQSGSVFGNIAKSSVGTLGANFTTTLGLTADDILSDVQSEVDTQIAAINKQLAAGIVVPSIRGIDLSDFELDFFKGYLEFGMSIEASFWDYMIPFETIFPESEEIIIIQ